MRLAFALFILLSACGAKRSAPAWPKMTEKETDGGESLAPRAKASAVAAAADDDDDDDAVVKVEDKVEAKTETKPETPKAATPTAPQPSEEIIITTEEIVIEIDE